MHDIIFKIKILIYPLMCKIWFIYKRLKHPINAKNEKNNVKSQAFMFHKRSNKGIPLILSFLYSRFFFGCVFDKVHILFCMQKRPENHWNNLLNIKSHHKHIRTEYKEFLEYFIFFFGICSENRRSCGLEEKEATNWGNRKHLAAFLSINKFRWI